MQSKRNREQLEKDIASVLGRMGELMDNCSVAYIVSLPNTPFNEIEFGRRWIIPEAEITYNSYVKILAQLNEEKIQNGKL